MNEPGYIEYSNYFSGSSISLKIDNSSSLTYDFGQVLLP